MMRWQAEELNRVSWHMLGSQEDTARRFSHEMHDELGQSLTGLKAMLLGMRAGDFEVRKTECIELLDESIRNVRELSQLLRPVVLDDFGLDAALRWLCDRFRQRTHIDVDYESNLAERLPERTETHLFRITQEALTNVARHSQATETRVSLIERAGRVTLTIVDNGRGFVINGKPEVPGLGVTGMRARARQIGGECLFESGNGIGVRITILASVERPKSNADEENACSPGRRS